jgi:alpha-glucosidase (family GH31 glycosyl hydrolase)
MATDSLETRLLPDEWWWGGAADDGVAMPFGAAPHARDLAGSLAGNQGAGLLLSSKGRVVWSEDPFAFAFADGALRVRAAGDGIEVSEGHGTLAGGFRHVARTNFPPAGAIPDVALFAAPQYNTWTEMMYEPTAEKVLAYAEAVLATGMPPGVLIVDDNWQEDYGVWRFHPGRFPAPGRLVNRLHDLGFKVMLWVCPFVSPDSDTFRQLRDRGCLLLDGDGAVAIRPWWNGFSAVLDCTNPDSVAWLHERLGTLMGDHGVDGFKFDAGDPDFYRPSDRAAVPTHPNGHCEAWARIGLRYPLNEYRACWKLGGQPLGQRLRDKHHAWDTRGLAALMPNGLAQGLLGYAFVCPDLIGGGEIESFVAPGFAIDQELVVRYAQCSALFPMMQFSAAPWRILDRDHLAACVEAAALHAALAPEILALARHAAVTGEPIVRHLAYEFIEGGYERVGDEFLLGDRILVAPVVAQGARRRTVVFPPGSWVGDDDSLVEGPSTREIAAPLSRLPWYRREDA